MKKLITFFIAIFIILLMFAGLFVTSAIYDAGKKQTIDTFFFQPNDLSTMRPGMPRSPAELGNGYVRDMLLKKFITEYFYATPDLENIAQRVHGKIGVAKMANSDVFKQWKANEAAVIQQLAEDKSLRTVYVQNEIYKPAGSDYWVVEYELRTWTTPNDMNETPLITRGRALLLIIYQPGIIEDAGVGEYLENNGDAAAIFKFRVLEVIIE